MSQVRQVVGQCSVASTALAEKCNTPMGQSLGATFISRLLKKARSFALLSGAAASAFYSTPAGADPAANPASFSQTTAATISTVVPDGTCSGKMVVTGGGGGSSPTNGGTGGVGAAGAVIGATFKVLPLQAVTGAAAGGGVYNIVNGGSAPGGTGYAAGGYGGAIIAGYTHRGAGGGGSSALVIAGIPIIIAGGGGGGSAAHQNTPAGLGGAAGFSGIGAGVVVAGTTGNAGVQSNGIVGGGQGGQIASGGIGGVNSLDATFNGFAGTGYSGGGPGSGVGGNGGNDVDNDSGGGGGGGYTGGGGGASELNNVLSGGGGGGGSSYVAATSPILGGTAPTSITGAVGPASPTFGGNGVVGAATIDWIPCLYTLLITKSASPSPVNAGAKAVWTVSVTNTGPDAMTRGDTVSLADTLPATVNSAVSPAFKVLSVSSSGGTNANMASGAISCTGVTVGAAMPTSTVCSRAYDASSAPGAPTGGTRGLNSGETLTITYEQVTSNKAACTTISNTASTLDRSSTSGTTDIIGMTAARSATTPLTVQCYDLSMTKTVSPITAAANQPFTWTMVVKNLGAADMQGPDDPASNPLVVTDVAPVTSLSTPAAFTSSGPAGACTYSAGTITCPSSLASGQIQTFTFQQTPVATVAAGTIFNNTATATDFNSGDSNDASTASITVAPTKLTLTKISNGAVGGFTFTGNNGWTSQTITTISSGGLGVTGATQTLAAAATSTTINETIPADYTLASVSCTGLGLGGTANANLSTGALVLDVAATAAGSNIACTFTNTKTPTMKVQKTTLGDFGGPFTFTQTNLASPPASITTTAVSTATPSVPTAINVTALSTDITLTETLAAGYVITSAACTDANSAITGNAGSLGTLSGNTLTVLAANVKPGADLTCNFTNSKLPKLTLIKTVTNNTGGSNVVGDFTLTATGPTTISGVTGAVAVTNASVNAGTYVLTESGAATANYVPGSWSCTAGTLTGNSLVLTAGQSASCSINNDDKPKLTLVKSVVNTGGGVATTANFTLTATGPTIITGISAAPAVTNAMINIGTYTLSESSLASYTGGAWSCSAGTLTGSSLVLGSSNNATCTITNTFVPAPALSVGKATSIDPGLDAIINASDIVTYTYTVINTGNVPLTAAKPVDSGPKFNGINGTNLLSSYAPLTATTPVGGNQVFTATYTLSQTDVNNAAGVTNGMSNTATATGTPPIGAPVNSGPSTTLSTIPLISTLATIKSATGPSINLGSSSSITDTGDTITYSYSVKNNGNVTLTNVAPIDTGPQFNAIAATNALSAFTPATATLAPGATQIFTATYMLALADINNAAGVSNGVTNSATASGQMPNGTTTTSPSSNATATIPLSSTLATVKAAATPTISSGTLTTLTDANDTITYTYTVTNTGNVSLTNVKPVDAGPTFGGSAATGSLSAFAPLSATLAPGAQQVFTATYTLLQTDVNNAAGIANGVVNSATSTGTQPSGGTTTSPVSTASTTIPKSSTLTLTKSAAAPTVSAGVSNSKTDGNDTIVYTYTVKNTGNVTLTNAVPIDAGPTFATISGTGTLSAFAPLTAILAPNATQVFTATYTLSQTDVNNAAGVVNGVENTATAAGTQPSGASTTSAPSTAKTTIVGGPSLAITKTPSTSSVSALPTTIAYTINVANTGNVTLTGVILSDALTQNGALTLTSGPTLSSGDINTNSKIDVSETWSYTATYVVTQANMDSGLNIVNIASVTTSQTTIQSATATTSIAQSGALTTLKSIPSVTTSNGVINTETDGLDVITFNYRVTNTGNLTLNNVTPVDVGPKFNGIAGTNSLSAFTPAPTTLVPGAFQNFSATYILSQTDVNNAAGITNGLANTAKSTGKKPDNTNTTSPDNTASTTIGNQSSMTLLKTGTLMMGGNGRADVGDQVSYAFTVTNTGNTTLTSIGITDALVGVTVSGGPITLAPGAINSTSITATYTLTQADVDAGTIVNSATANGKDPRNATVSATDGETVTLPPAPSMTIDKTTTSTSFDAVGTQLNYNYLVTNTGNVTLATPITVVDDVVNGAGGTVTCAAQPPLGLAPGATLSCTAAYNVVQADIDAGQVVNTASATSGSTTSPSDQITILAIKNPSMSIVKTPVNVNFTVVGDQVDYEYLVTNTGNTTITAPVTVSDNVISGAGGSVTCPALQPGGLTPAAPNNTLLCTATYIVTQDDLDLGSVTNLATATDGTTVSPPTSAIIPASAMPALTVDKIANTLSFSAVGDVLSYTFNVTNTGNVTLTKNINIVDDKTGTFFCFVTNFIPGDTNSCSATYTVTQADLDLGYVTNTAFAQTKFGSSPISVTSAPDRETSTAIKSPAITLVKSAATLPVTTVGQVLTYGFAVTNSGNQTISNISVTDPLIPSLSCTITTLAPTATDTTCSGLYTVTQGDIDAGSIVNTAHAAGISPQGTPVTVDDSLTTPMPAAAPTLQLTKTPSLSSFSTPGEVIGYVFAVTNTGNVTLSNVKVTDPLIPALITAPACTIATLAPGATNNSCSGNYAVTQADIDGGSVLNTASVTGKDPINTTVNQTANATVNAAQTPALIFNKTATLNLGANLRADAGDTIIYTFRVENSGNVTMTNVSVTDPLITVLGSAITLAPGAADTTTFTGTYILLQTDIDAGLRDNTANAKGTPPIGADVSVPDTLSTPLSASPAIIFSKTATLNDGGNSRADVGDTITYTFAAQNTGNVTLTNVMVTDPLVTVSGGPIATLAPGAIDSTTFTAVYTLTTADLNAGTRSNTAQITANPPTGPPITNTAIANQPLAADPSMILTKVGTLNDDGNGRADAGDTISYVFTVQNTGNVTLTNVTVTDPLVTVTGGPLASLAAGATDTTTFTALYTLTAVDVNSGSVINNASVAGTPPTGPPVTAPATNTTTLPTLPALALTKIGTLNDGGDGVANVGDTISYVFTVQNTGNVDLTAVTVTDPLVTVSGGPLANLAAGVIDTTTFTALYTLTATDVNAGILVNNATVTGAPPTGANVTAPATNTTTLSAVPSMALTKTGTLNDGSDGVANVGDTISYVFTVQNTGNVTLTAVTVTDPLVTVLGGPLASLAAGVTDSTTFTALYTLTATDIDAGTFVNNASVAGTPPTGPAVTAPATNTTVLPVVPSIVLTKVGTLNDGGNGQADAGDTISYVFTVKNSGNVTLTSVSVSDPLVTVNGGPIPSLASGVTDATTFTAIYTLTAADLNAGIFVNNATVAGLPPTGPAVTAPASNTTNLPPVPSMTMSKVGTLNDGGDGVANIGDTISYVFTVKNTGNVALADVAISDALVTVSGGPLASLGAGATDSTTFTALYTLTATDVDAGTVVNNATVTGSPPTGPDVTAPATNTTNLPAAPAITLTKIGTLNDGGDGVANIGDTISYVFTVQNTGNVTLTAVTVTDPLVTVSGGPLASLAAGATDATTFTALYTLTATDVNAGTLVNSASVTGKPPTGPDVSAVATNTTTLPSIPSLTLTKVGALNDGGDGVANVGDTISYVFTVQNIGNVTLTAVIVTDPLVTVSGGPLASLAAGATDATTFTALYTLTTSDVNAGSFVNNATVVGTPPSGPAVTAPASNTTNLPSAPVIALSKLGTLNDGGDGVVNIGDTISYVFTVQNTGNVTLTNVVVTDALVTVSGGPLASLAAGATDTATFTALYTLTAADLNAGTLVNTASVAGTPPSGPAVTAPASNTTNLPSVPAMTLSKAGNLNDGGDGVANIGDTISYVFTVKNTGNVALTNVSVSDPLVTVSGGPLASLAAGAMDTTTFTALYTLTSPDVNSGTVLNNATATGTPPTGPVITAPGSTTTPLASAPSLALTKVGTLNDGGDGIANIGDTISYVFTVQNTGNVSLTNVTVTDPLVTVSGGPLASLAAGVTDTTTFTAVYTLTTADVNAGTLVNTASVAGTPPTGPAVTALATSTITLPPAPSLALTKVGTLNDGGDGVVNIGDTISYAFTVQNIGNVTLTNVTVTDALVTVSGGPLASLAAGATDVATFTALYTLTASDVNAGTLVNTATVAGTPPTGPAVTAPATHTTNLAAAPAMTLAKNGSLNDGGDGIANVGDTISYTFTVVNTGNVTLTNINVTDPLVTVSGGPIASLAAGAADSTTFTALYTLTAADVNAGAVLNNATVTGTPPTGPAITAPGSTATPLVSAPSLALSKVGALNDGGDGVANVGDTISYVFTVQNTGNVTLNAITVTDPLVTVSGGPLATLAAGTTDATTFTALYTLTTADVNAGTIVNNATVSGTPPTGPAVTAPATNTTPLPSVPSFAFTKVGTLNDGGNGRADAGDTISYIFSVQNTGNVTLTNVTVTDPLVTVSGGPLASLATGAIDTTTFTALYTLTAADVNSGSVINNASVSGTPPTGPVVTTPATNTTNLSPQPTMTLTKDGTLNDGGDGIANVGDTIAYVFTVRNTGNVSLSNITVTDALATVAGGPLASLAAGATDSTTFTALYTLTASDVNAGTFVNNATVSGTPPTGPAVTAPATNTTTLPSAAAIGLVKSSTFIDQNGDGFAQVGETISYAFSVRNIGNVTLANIVVTDPKVTVVGGPIASLNASATDNTTFTASYTLTATDLTNPNFANTASVTGNPAIGPPVSDISDSDKPADGTNHANYGTGVGKDDPTVTPLLRRPLLATNDTATNIDGLTGNANVFNIFGNDTYGVSVVSPPNVVLTIDPTNPVPPELTFDPSTGQVSVAPGTAPGTYDFIYTICEVSNPNNCSSAIATVVVVPTIAAVTGTVYIDQNGDGLFNGDPNAGPGYAVQLIDAAGTIVGTAMTDANGTYSISAPPATGYKVVFLSPTGAVIGTLLNVTLNPGTTTADQNEPIDPSGIVYNSVTRLPVSGVIVTLTDAGGTPLPAACLLPGQQGQVTNATGAYRFEVIPGAAAACPIGQTEYHVMVVTPTGYLTGVSTALPSQAGLLNSLTCPIDAIPGGACNVSAVNTPPAVGSPAVYFTKFTIGVGSPDIVYNHIAIDPLPIAPATFTKTAGVATAKRGEIITYTIEAKNVSFTPASFVDVMPAGFNFVTGSGLANGVGVTPTIAGNTLTFIGLTPNASNTITLILKLVVNADVVPGPQINHAEFINPATGGVIARAQASVEIIAEHVFDCGDIIGKVFDDKNRNGYQDGGEIGLPGVRVVTVKGELITTDKNGRFHVGCADIPDANIGSNFILKLDTRTLPTGYRVTTENPRTVRLTRGKVTKLNFGASITRVIRLDLTDKLYQGAEESSPELQVIVRQLVSILVKEPSTLRLTYYVGSDGSEIASKRLKLVQSLVKRVWKARAGRHELPIEARVVGVK